MPPSRQGTGFTNLQTYLGLNQGIAGRMGNTLAGDVERQGSQVAGDIQSEADKTREAIRNSTLQMPGQGPITSQQATDLSGKEYNGPLGMGAEALTRLYGQASAAQNHANALNSNTGRSTLLQQKYGANTWGGGQLDAALAGGGSAGGRMAGAAGAYGRLLKTLGSTQTTLQEQGRAAAESTKKAQEAYAGMIPGLQQKEADVAAKKAEEGRLRRQEQRQNIARDNIERYRDKRGDSDTDDRNYVP